MTQTVKWLPRPEKHDLAAAEDYLSLIMPVKRAADYRRQLAAARDDITHRKAKDILRASQLALHIQVQMLVNHVAAVALGHVVNLDHRLGRDVCALVANGGRKNSRHQIPTRWKMMAKTASARITMVIDVTTEGVVPSPRLCEFALMRKPK